MGLRPKGWDFTATILYHGPPGTSFPEVKNWEVSL